MIQYIADAFTSELFSGNPAAVLPCRKMPASEMMQSIAMENNCSETAFVVKKGEGKYDLRWFTPGGEVSLCGHATMATAFILDRYVDKGVGKMVFSTLSGDLIVSKAGNGYEMDFPEGSLKPFPLSEAILKATGGLAKEAYYDGGDMVTVLESEDDLISFVPDFSLMKKVEGRGLVMTAPSEKYDFVSRCFYPKLEVPEDPVTGSAHTFLAPLWAARLGKNEFLARQVSRRGGDLGVRLSSGRVFIRGEAVLYMKGEIPFDF